MSTRFVFTLLLSVAYSENINNAVETEMFAVPISPNLFNWTYQEWDEQYRFEAAVRGRPELPPWLRYVHSARRRAGFVFGTPPPAAPAKLTLEVVGLNRQDYETRRTLITLNILPREKMALHEVELKIDNLNVEDLLDEHRMTRLKDILRTKLWTESKQDLYPTFLSSAIDLGARLPLKPGDGEGLVVRLGSSVPFSAELKRLREEVRPLSRLPSCPREYKRTTVERLFRDAGFTLDWCSFELYNTIYEPRSTVHVEYLTDAGEARSPPPPRGARPAAAPAWSAPPRRPPPRRGAARALLAALAPPLLLLVLALAALTAALCYRHAAMSDAESERFLRDIYHICSDYRRNRAHKAGKTELCRYAAGAGASGDTDADAGAAERTQPADSASDRSPPLSSPARPYSPKAGGNLAGSYNRPQPPPYPPAAAGSLQRRRPGDGARTPPSGGHSPDRAGRADRSRTHLALEESLQLLNEANIGGLCDDIPKDRVVDLSDGAEDYVLVAPEPDLDDIHVPELGVYGVPGVGGGAGAGAGAI